MTMLAWGMLDSRAGYERAGQWANAIASLRWGTDYMIRVKQLSSLYDAEILILMIF